MRVHCLILGLGYVESSRLSSLITWHRGGFDTVEEAIESLGAMFLEATKQDLAYQASYSKKHQRCPHCDEPWLKEREIEQDDVEEFIRQIAGSDCDSSGGDFWENMQSRGWQTGLAELPRVHWAEAVNIFEYAEYIVGDVAFGGRTIVDEGAHGWEYRFDWHWPKHMQLPEGMTLYKETP